MRSTSRPGDNPLFTDRCFRLLDSVLQIDRGAFRYDGFGKYAHE